MAKNENDIIIIVPIKTNLKRILFSNMEIECIIIIFDCRSRAHATNSKVCQCIVCRVANVCTAFAFCVWLSADPERIRANYLRFIFS